jgi:hypothetical protein
MDWENISLYVCRVWKGKKLWVAVRFEVVCDAVDKGNCMLHLKGTIALYICEQHRWKYMRTIVVRIRLTGQPGRWVRVALLRLILLLALNEAVLIRMLEIGGAENHSDRDRSSMPGSASTRTKHPDWFQYRVISYAHQVLLLRQHHLS